MKIALSYLIRSIVTTIAQHIVETLKDSGVERVWGVAGDSLNGLTDAIRRTAGIKWVPVRHEEAGAFAASAEAATTGELAVTVGSCGPGNLHLINGLYDANRSRVPVLAIAAHIPHDEIGGSYFQETHPEIIFQECSVYCELVSMPEQMPRILRSATRAALDKRGVAVLVIPGNVLLSETDAKPEKIESAPFRAAPADDQLDEAAKILNSSKKISILAGAGCQGAHDEIIEIADKLQAPMVHSMRGKEWVAYDNPFDVGMTGLLGFTSGYNALKECDTLLVLGCDLPYRQFYPQDAKVIQVDIDGQHIGRRVDVDLPLVGTVRDTVQALLPKLKGNKSSAHLKSIQKDYAKSSKDLKSLAKPTKRGKIHPQFLADLLNTYATDDAVFIPDVGSPVIWAARYIDVNGKRRIIGSFNHGSMANAMPMAMGVQAAFPSRQVIAMSGDGGLSMLLGDLLSLKQNGLPVKIVVFNNSSLNFVELEMKSAGYVNFATDLQDPNFADIANAVGLKGYRVEKGGQLEKTVKEFLAHDGPAVLDVITDRQELTIPPTLELDQVKGFSLYAMRTVLSGRGSELIDMARTNLRQLPNLF